MAKVIQGEWFLRHCQRQTRVEVLNHLANKVHVIHIFKSQEGFNFFKILSQIMYAWRPPVHGIKFLICLHQIERVLFDADSSNPKEITSMKLFDRCRNLTFFVLHLFSLQMRIT